VRRKHEDENRRTLVDSLGEVPHFKNDEECAAYWESHTPSDAFIRSQQLAGDDPRVKRLRQLIASDGAGRGSLKAQKPS
jgi:hypothetical protein